MNQTPKVSILLTSYNHAKYLRESIDSALGQTFGDFELILWDDASTDESWSIIKSYSDPRIRAIRNGTNEATGYLGRAILQETHGEYIAMHHSDDIWESQKLEKQVGFLDQTPQVGAVFSWANIILQDGSPLKDQSHFYHHVFDQPDRTRYQWLNYFFFQGNALCHPSALVRRACYDECGLYRPALAQLPDFDMWVRLCLKYEIRVLAERLVRFRTHSSEENVSGNRPEVHIRGWFEYLQVLENYRKLCGSEDLFKVFPSAEKYVRPGGFDPGFALGMVSLEAGRPFNDLFGLNLLFEALDDPDRAARINKLYHFRYADLISLTGERDIFFQKTIQELSDTISDQMKQSLAEKAELSAIKLSRSWRFITRLQKLRLALLPLGSRRERLLYSLLRLSRPHAPPGAGLQELPSLTNENVPPAAVPAIHVEPVTAVKNHDTAIILHLFYPQMWQEFSTYFLNLGDQADLYITAPFGTELPEDNIKSQFPAARIYRFENRGRDIAPFLALFSAMDGLGYKYLCKLHTKKSPQIGTGAEWRQDILEKLLGSSERILRIREEFDKNPALGIIAPKGHIVPHTYFWRNNAAKVSALAKKLNIRIPDSGFSYIAGSMFWFRPAALAPILRAGLSMSDFEPEAGQLDGTLAHAIERVFGLAALAGGYEIAEGGLERIESPEISFQFRMALWVLEQREREIRELSERFIGR